MRFLDSLIFYWNNKRDAYSKAECYREGRLVKQSTLRALVFYRKAAQQGDARAYFWLGQHAQAEGLMIHALEMYFQAGVKNHNEAVSQLENLVTQNNAQAGIVLGKIFEQKKQYEIAAKWYKKAHKLKHPDGMYYFGQLYPNLSSAQIQNINVANRYRESARLGSKYGFNELVRLSASNEKASLHLAQMYDLGEGGLQKNILRAVEFYEKSSQLRCNEATYYLAELYAKGKPGILIDIFKACRYYLLASQQGHLAAISSLTSLANSGDMHAQYSLGHDYYRVKNDIANAILWCVKAEKQNYALAVNYLKSTFTAEIYWKIARQYDASSEIVNLNQKKAVEYAIKASNLGVKEASGYLATIFQSGNLGNPVDRQKSYYYYALAAKQGHESSRQALEELAESGNKEAQYHLGYDYYREQNEVERAVYWCVKAEVRGHKKAADYLNIYFSAEICWVIGYQYEKDSFDAETSLPKAINFFKKAAHLQHAQASFWLAQYYQSVSDQSVENKTAAFNYFLQSAQQGVEAALPALERLGDYGNAKQQTTISQLYGSLFYNPERSVYWSTKNKMSQSNNIHLMK